MLFKHQNKTFRKPFVYLGNGEAPAASEPHDSPASQDGAANLRLNAPGPLRLDGVAGALSMAPPSAGKPDGKGLTLSTTPIIAPGTLGSLQIAAAANPDLPGPQLSLGAAGSSAPASAMPDAAAAPGLEAAPAAPTAPVELPEDILSQNLEGEAQSRAQALLTTADARFKRMIVDTGQSRAISSEVGELPQGVSGAPQGFILTNELTAAGDAAPNTLTKRERHFFPQDIKNGRTFAYVLTHERGEKMGRLRVRDEKLKLSKDRIEPGTKITILTNEPVRIKKVKDPQADGGERTLIYVKVEYKTKSGQTSQNYVALDYLVSPFDHGDAAVPGPAPAPAAPSAPDAPAPAPDAPAPSPAPAAPVAPPPAPAAPEAPPPAPAPAPAPAAPAAPAEQPRETLQPGQEVRILLYGEKGALGKYLGSVGDYVKVQRQIPGYEGRIRVEYYRREHIVSKDIGKQIPKAPSATNLPQDARIITKKEPGEQLKPGDLIRVDNENYNLHEVPERFAVYFIEHGTGETIVLNPGVQYFMGEAVTYLPPPHGEYGQDAYVGNVKGRILRIKDRQTGEFSYHPSTLMEQPNFGRMPEGAMAEALANGEIPDLGTNQSPEAWKLDNFYRVSAGFNGMNAGEIVYVINPDPKTPEWTFVRSNGQYVKEVPSSSLDRNPPPSTSIQLQYQEKRIRSFVKELDLAGIEGHPKFDLSRVYQIKDKPGEFVFQREDGKFEKTDGTVVAVDAKNLKGEAGFFERTAPFEEQKRIFLVEYFRNFHKGIKRRVASRTP